MNLPIQKLSKALACFVSLFVLPHFSHAIDMQDYKVSYFVSRSVEPLTVLIDAGSKQGITEGTLFKTYRPNSTFKNIKDSVLVETGILKAVDVQAESTLAEVIKDGSALSNLAFKKCSGIMAGDKIKEFTYNIERKLAITSTVNLKFTDLFEEPRFGANSMELSKSGEQLLQESLDAFKNIRVNNLIVEAHTDSQGSSDMQQMESQHRAMAVKQYMISELGFDANKLVAIGFGAISPEAIANNQYSDSKTSRRITIKVLD